MDFLEKHLVKIGFFLLIGSFLGFFSGGLQIPSALWIIGIIYMANKYKNDHLPEGGKSNNVFLGQTNNLPPQNFELTDEMIIRLARILNNKLSVDDLITQSSLTREKAKERLEMLAQKGICEIRLDDVQNKGKVFYYFD